MTRAGSDGTGTKPSVGNGAGGDDGGVGPGGDGAETESEPPNCGPGNVAGLAVLVVIVLVTRFLFRRAPQ